jgi:alpha-methylacyl-CoA racemase
MTGWGQAGPLARRAGHDITYIAVTGALEAIGPCEGTPSIPLNLLGDFAGGSLFLLVGILSALVERSRSGRGQVIDAAIVDGAASLLTHLCGLRTAGLWDRPRGENLLDGGAPWYGVYETRDGRYMAVGAIEPKFYEELIAVLDLAGDPEMPGQWETDRWPEMRARLGAAFKRRTRDEWTRLFWETDACAAPVLSLEEAPAHLHLAARATFVDRDGTLQPSPAPRMSRTAPAVGQSPCAPGVHTDEILREADLTDEEIAELRARGIVGCP